jgi:hypothetical protein
MSTLQVNGRVFYADMSPASNVSVKVYDLDLGPGGARDLILTKTTRADGSFSGQTSNWNDREGRIKVLFKMVDLPDILNLHFEVAAAGRNHSGPLIVVNDNAAPIILPFGPPKPVSKNNRELVQIIYLTEETYRGTERLLYDSIELASGGLVSGILTNDYKMVHLIHGRDATLQKLKDTLIAAGSSGTTTAVDLIVCTHGNDDNLYFFDGGKTTADVQRVLGSIHENIRSKFRMLFSTACYGETHTNMWRNVGFDCASGAEGIYADSEVSLTPFLHAWETEKTFTESINIANRADVGNVADELAKAYYRAQQRNDTANDINSNRVVRGNGNLRIYSVPQ